MDRKRKGIAIDFDVKKYSECANKGDDPDIEAFGRDCEGEDDVDDCNQTQQHEAQLHACSDNEEAMCAGVSGTSDNSVKQMVFDSWEKAEAFYKELSKVVGFGIRRRDSAFTESGQPTMIKWVCSKQGHRDPKHYDKPNRKRKPKPETRLGCKAIFRIHFDPDKQKWTVTDFVSHHNHDLAKPQHVQFLPCHRSIKDGDQAQAKAMRLVGIKATQMMDYLAEQGGGYQSIGFTQKDIYNFLDSERRAEILKGDAQTTLRYFADKHVGDRAFFYDYNLTEDKQLANLFWADSTSRLDYAFFGDVVAFDAAYKRNMYNKPLVMLLGVNNHHQTIVFGTALLEDEQIKSYVWLLNLFLKCMGNKKPISVVTDGDMAMRSAIEQVFPNARHRLCAWHLERNAAREIKVPEFMKDFRSIMFDRIEVNYFERAWVALVAKYNLQDNNWIKNLYNERKMWAEAFLKGWFFAGVRTTSRCEGMHSFMNRFLHRKLNLFEFIQHFERALAKIRYNECQADHESTYSTPVCMHELRSYEKQAADVYTKASFRKFQFELSKESGYVQAHPTIEAGERRIYILCKHMYADRVRVIVYNKQNGTIKCSCKLLVSMGIPCRHAINVMKMNHMPSIPESCIFTRWTKEAKSRVGEMSGGLSLSKEVIAMVRYGSLTAKCNTLCSLASKSLATFNEISQEVTRLTKHLEQINLPNIQNTRSEQFCEVRDPKTIRTKGMTSAKGSKGKTLRKCGLCRQAGHFVPKCPFRGRPNMSIGTSDDDVNTRALHSSI